MLEFRRSATAAHVAPLAIFLLLGLIPDWLRIENSALPWYRRAPEHWVFPIQTLAGGALLWLFRGHYRLAPWRGLGLALSLGVLGCVLWVAPAWLAARWSEAGWQAPGWLSALGFVERRQGFDPTLFSETPGWQAVVVALRFARMVVVVPLVEEIFWRGFLMRYLAAKDEPWQTVRFGTHTIAAFWGVTLLVMLAHQPADYPAAFAWGALVYLVAVRTRSLGACVVMHACCNLLLGLYVMKTGSWGFW